MLFAADSPPTPLVGIARMAAHSPLLEAKSQVEYFELPSRSILNRTKPGMPFRWTINPYRGCEFACRYCYARYTHEFMGMEGPTDFEDKIYAKAASAELLRQELKRLPRPEPIAIGTATDPYQPAERRFGRTRAILEVFAKEKGRSLGIVTKSDLIVRDIELLQTISAENTFDIHITITTVDTELARMLEPRAPRPDLRLRTVTKLATAGLSVSVFPNPVMPYLTDSEASLDRLACAAASAGARYFGGGPLFLMPCAQKVFFPFLKARFPHLVKPYRALYANSAYLGAEYKETLRRRIQAIRARYGLASSRPEYRPSSADEGTQLTLFSLTG